jgi:hypothetical protein
MAESSSVTAKSVDVGPADPMERKRGSITGMTAVTMGQASKECEGQVVAYLLSHKTHGFASES